MKKIIPYLLIEITLLFFFTILFPSTVIREGIGQNIEGGKPIISLENNKYYTQEISNPTGTLNSISLQLKNPLIQDNSLISIEILDTDGNLKRDFAIYGSNIGDPSWIKLKFAPLSEPTLLVRITADTPNDSSLYLFADDNGQIDLKTTYRYPAFRSRLIQNYQSQIKLFSQRSFWHNFSYLVIIILLNLYLFKLVNESQSKK